MSQLNENMRILAEEDDQYFINRSYGILHALDKRLVPYANNLLSELQEPYTVNNIPVIFVPISHYHVMGQEQEDKIAKDISDIVRLKLTDSSFVAIGESVDGEYSKENRNKQLAATLNKLSKLSVVPDLPLLQRKKLIEHLHGFEKALFDIKAHLEGVESLDGAIITTALDSHLKFTSDDDDDAFKDEIKHRIGIEGRTRLALKRANQRAINSSEIIFFQGAFHLEGVKGWCKRNSIDLKVIVPKSINSKFTGKKASLEFIG